MGNVKKDADGEWRDKDGTIIPEDTAEVLNDIDDQIDRLGDK